MRRIALWVASTVAVLMLLAGYHTSFAGPLAVTSTTSVYSTGVLADPATSGSSTAPAAGDGTASGSAGSTDGAADGSAASTTVTGDTVQTRWGPVQVQVGVAGSRITGVSVLQYPDDNPQDVRINDYALPILVDATMTAQGADIDMVSGATYTSVGYHQSLQSALDRAGL